MMANPGRGRSFRYSCSWYTGIRYPSWCWGCIWCFWMDLISRYLWIYWYWYVLHLGPGPWNLISWMTLEFFYNCLPVVFYNFRWWWSLVSSILPLFSHLSTHPPSWRRSLLHSYVEYSSWRCFDSVSSRLVVINGRALGPLRNVSLSWSSIELTLPLSKLSYPVMVIRSANLG